GYHVRSASVDGPLDDSALESFAAREMRARLDRKRPLWMLHVLTSPGENRWALLWKLHHCMADGSTAMWWGSRLLWDSSASDASPHAPGAGRGASGAPGPVSEAASASSGRTRRAGRFASWREAAAVCAGLPGTLRRELRPLAHPSPLCRPAGVRRQVAFASFGLEELRTLGKAVDPGVTVNDTLLALLAGAIRVWLGAEGHRGAHIRVQVPVCMHPPSRELDPRANSDSFFFVDLPVLKEDTVQQLVSICKQTSDRKNHHDAQNLYAVFEVLSRFSKPLYRWASQLTTSPREYSLNVSNVPGPRGPAFVLGSRMRAMYSLAEISQRHGLRATAVSLSGSLFIGLCADPDAVPRLELLIEGLKRSYAQLKDGAGRRPSGGARTHPGSEMAGPSRDTP
ncbi:MAG TPA: WS/DGAT domain-containing protein, partial [Actinomycetota bacterium]|nr:WS/DGAT domain-containing protein [Actinomycetota bacterium]